MNSIKNIAAFIIFFILIFNSILCVNANKSILPFDDLVSDAWYIPGIQYCYENGIMSGMGGTTFAPSATLTREQFIQVLFNLSSPDKDDLTGTTGFDDVREGRWYSPAIKWAKAAKITSGVKENVFGIGQSVTREQLAVFIKNFVDHMGVTANSDVSLDSFTDADKVSEWAVDGVSFCVDKGIINGKSETILDPKGYATRAELAQMMSVFLESGILYRVEFDSNGADSCDVKFRYIPNGSDIGELQLPEKEGYKFDGWWYNGERITANTVFNLTDDITIEAKWGEGNRVFFVTEGGECSEEYRYIVRTEALGTLPVPTRNGYSFEGWLFELGEESYVVSEDTVIDVDFDYTLTAQWKPVDNA